MVHCLYARTWQHVLAGRHDPHWIPERRLLPFLQPKLLGEDEHPVVARVGAHDPEGRRLRNGTVHRLEARREKVFDDEVGEHPLVVRPQRELNNEHLSAGEVRHVRLGALRSQEAPHYRDSARLVLHLLWLRKGQLPPRHELLPLLRRMVAEVGADRQQRMRVVARRPPAEARPVAPRVEVFDERKYPRVVRIDLQEREHRERGVLHGRRRDVRG